MPKINPVVKSHEKLDKAVAKLNKAQIALQDKHDLNMSKSKPRYDLLKGKNDAVRSAASVVMAACDAHERVLVNAERNQRGE